MSKESVLTSSEKESFKIEKFIFHIIIEGDLKPTYLDEVVLTESQEEFFKKRFSDVSQGTQYVFIDRNKSELFNDCSNILKDPNLNFVNISKKITASFKQHHNKNTNDGVFITSLVSIQDGRKLIFLLKLDHRIVYQYKISRNKALLEEIKNTFVEDKKAIQKVALIDVSDDYKWDVLATDRTASSLDTGIRDYFSKFLSVTERETPGKLTNDAVRFVNQWAIANREDLDPSQEVSSYKSRAIQYLFSTNKFDSKDFIKIIIKDEDSNRRAKLLKSLKNHLELKGLSGQTFVPHKGSLTAAKKKNVRQTAEGIRLEWQGDPQESNLTIPSEKKEDGYYHIIIKTSNIKILDSSK